MTREKVRTMKIRTLKFKKEHQKCFKASEHQKCPSEFPKSDQNVENQKYQLPMADYLWIPRPVGG
jgi:hypothetical protein